jgi:AraC-like DNA-binding protein
VIVPGSIDTIEFEAPPGVWRLSRALPAAPLAHAVREFWEVKGALKAFRETLLPNGCVEIMINLGPPHRVHGGQGAGEWTDAWYSGLHERAISIETEQGTHLVSARLHPLGAAELLGQGVATHSNNIVELQQVLGEVAARLATALRAADGPAERFAMLERMLLERLGGHMVPEAVRWAAGQIEQSHGRSRVTALAEGTEVSRKHLATSFRRYVGMSAKSYAQIHRFLWTMGQLQASEHVQWSTLALDAGYSDQSHLARDFRRIGAASPVEYLKRRTPDGAALWATDEG